MVELLDRMREVERLIAFEAPFEEVVAKIDQCLELEPSDEYRASIEHFRVRAYAMYGRPVDEVEDVLDSFLELQPALTHRAQVLLAACGLRPELAPRYLDEVIADLEQAAPSDPVAENALQDAYRLRQRVTGGP